MSVLHFSRRRALLGGLAALTAAAAAPTAWALSQPQRANGRLLVVFLRGGLDGLFAFGPTTDPRFAELRPTLSRPLLEGGLPLVRSGFAAHPALAPLAELYASRELSFAPCFGTTDESRSHFQAQDLFELGNGQTRGASGWLARAAQAAGSELRCVGFGSEQPLILQGAAVGRVELMPLAGAARQVRADRALAAIRAMHAEQASGAAIEQALATQSELDRLGGMDPQAARGANGVAGFPKLAARMAQILRSDPRLALAFIDLGGFDTHAGQAASLGRSLPALAEGLLALREGLGDAEWRRTQVLVCSEFGRTARENGTQGSDHGHGGLALLLGGAPGRLGGGRLLGDFSGLAETALHQRRDLPVRLDWRSVLGRLLQESLGFPSATLTEVLPGMPGLA